jgi:hypothetical protein
MNRLFFRYLLLFCCFLPAWGICLPAVVLGNETATGLLVLRNGNVIEGRITRLADHFRVELGHGELQVRVNQVEMFCLTLDEAYERRRAMRTGSTADSHLALASWCLRHKLCEYASREILEARAIDPHHRKLLLLERQLNQALKFQNPPPKLPKPKKLEPAQPEVDLALLEQAPQWARAMFVRKIQPMLVKSCATTGCHQTNSTTELQLNQHAVLGAGHPVATKYNMVSVLDQVDFQNGVESPLLRFAATVHGGGRSTALPPRKLQILRAWVEQLAVPNSQVGESSDVQQASVITVGPSSVAKLSESFKRAQDNSELRSKMPLAGHVSSDPFDPEVFNRLYPSHPGVQKSRQLVSPPKTLPQASVQFPTAQFPKAIESQPVARSPATAESRSGR